ncbi:hypothetical protein, partial [Actinacidiphila sp. bgisy167]|uniref:hypothetical protein n=1 Tax=Actinacidiphila sp. bgisy167 TaxID=3413797 RepID=UPI003D712511
MPHDGPPSPRGASEDEAPYLSRERFAQQAGDGLHLLAGGEQVVEKQDGAILFAAFDADGHCVGSGREAL